MKRWFTYSNIPIPLRTLLLLGFIVVALLILQKYIDHVIVAYDYPFSWNEVSTKIVVNYAYWLLLIPSVSIISKKMSKVSTKDIKGIITIALSIILLSIIHAVITQRTYDIFYFFESGYLRSFLSKNGIISLSGRLFYSLLELSLITTLFVAVTYQKKYLDNQKQLATAQLRALKMQLNPHFLFNTLNSITSMMDINITKAQRMMIQLSDLLRSILKEESNLLITLEAEMNFIENYLELEQTRFEDRITITIDLPTELTQSKIPSLILQPIIENAIKFTINENHKQGKIDLIFSKIRSDKSDYLKIEVKNTVKNEMGLKKDSGLGIGLNNIQQRLKAIYIDDFEFSSAFVESSDIHKVIMIIPYTVTT